MWHKARLLVHNVVGRKAAAGLLHQLEAHIHQQPRVEWRGTGLLQYVYPEGNACTDSRVPSCFSAVRLASQWAAA